MSGNRDRKKRKKRERQLNDKARRGKAKDKAKPKKDDGKIPATKADYLAVLLHGARETSMTLRGVLLSKEKILGEKDAEIARLRVLLLESEIREEAAKNADLREEHGLVMDRVIEKNDKTGEVFWIIPPGAAKTEKQQEEDLDSEDDEDELADEDDLDQNDALGDDDDDDDDDEDDDGDGDDPAPTTPSQDAKPEIAEATPA